MSASLPLLSPLVTRILELSGFPPELKTRDIQTIFSTWEDDRGGFKIKWVDDTTALIIFADPAVAKRAYLHTLMSPPAALMTAAGVPAKLRPYDGEDASQVIASVQNRPRSRSNAGHEGPHHGSLSPSNSAAHLQGSPRHSANRPLAGVSGHRRTGSGSNPSSLPPKPLAAALFDAANGGPSPAHHLAAAVAAEQQQAAAAAAASGGSGKSPLANAKALPTNPLQPLKENGTIGSPKLGPAADILTGAGDASATNGGSGRVGDAGKVGA